MMKLISLVKENMTNTFWKDWKLYIDILLKEEKIKRWVLDLGI